MLKIFAIWTTVVGLGLLNACAHKVEQADAASWHLFNDGATAKLAYGPPNTDAVGLMMECGKAQGLVTVYGDVEPGQAALTLASGRSVSDLRGRTYSDQLSPGVAFEGEAPVTIDALRGFARTGKLSIIGQKSAKVMPARGDDRADVRKFFDFCQA
jgi:hypothetical protein